MELINEFEVPVSVDEAWRVLTDVERIAPCLPGAELKEIEGDEYRGTVKVKVGPITVTYRGTARFLELDEAAHRAVMRAEGRESRGQGNASATITSNFAAVGDGTKVSVVTDLSITGKVAQFGRGVLDDVSAKLLTQFVENLESSVLAPGAADARATRGPSEGDGEAAEPSEHESGQDGVETKERSKGSFPSSRVIESEPAEPVDLVGIAGPSLARRLLPYASIAGALFLLRIVVYALRRRKS